MFTGQRRDINLLVMQLSTNITISICRGPVGKRSYTELLALQHVEISRGCRFVIRTRLVVGTARFTTNPPHLEVSIHCVSKKTGPLLPFAITPTVLVQ